MSQPNDPPGADVVIALYRPREGRDAALRALLDRHRPCLEAQDFVTDRPTLLLRGSDGTYLEIFEWKPGAAGTAHRNEAVMALWNEMEAVCEFVELGSLPEAAGRFPHFTAVD